MSDSKPQFGFSSEWLGESQHKLIPKQHWLASAESVKIQSLTKEHRMHIGIIRETTAGETRVAATPETVKKLLAIPQVSVSIESGAGQHAALTDEAFAAVGATIATDAKAVLQAADIILCVRTPDEAQCASLKKGAAVIGMLNPFDAVGIARLQAAGVHGFAMEKLPRITRAQVMDVLSSQANIAGYKAVLLAAQYYPKFFPMLMTAAGTVKAARVLILGVGVAGLQAIATAKRLGAIVEAFDVRPETKEQAESLGAKFIEVPLTEAEKETAKGAGGYAKEMSEDYKARQAALIAERAKLADIIITTALIPGRPAPVLLPASVVPTMKPGSVIVDLAAEQGGNCPLTEKNQVVQKHGVTLVGTTNIAGLVAQDASHLYSRNLLAFLELMLDKKTGILTINREDEVVKPTLVTTLEAA
jgi:H+-translocating NAD(P) transhydrogenase subunit alpha